MKQEMLKRFIANVLAIAMVISLLSGINPITAYAEDGETAEELQSEDNQDELSEEDDLLDEDDSEDDSEEPVDDEDLQDAEDTAEASETTELSEEEDDEELIEDEEPQDEDFQEDAQAEESLEEEADEEDYDGEESVEIEEEPEEEYFEGTLLDDENLEEENSTNAEVFEASETIDDVKVTVTADEGVFPAGSTLKVEKVENLEQKEVEEALEEARDDSVKVAVSYTYDIKVLDEDGNEIQPKDGQSVNVSFEMVEAANDNLNVDVYHIPEDDSGNLVAQALDVEQEGETITANTEGFSFYTVEFTYEQKQYVMNGNTTIALSDILSEVNLSGTVESVTVSNPELFSASDETGTWLVTSHKAFSSNEWMKVTLDGVEYEIVVTDTPDTCAPLGMAVTLP